jgi:hypothetical protein
MRSAFQSHWFCLVYLLPAAGMIALHEALGLSDVMGAVPVGQRPPTDGELFFNYSMVGLFYLGILGYVIDAVRLASRGWKWVVVKLLLLAVGWWALLYVPG